MMKKSNYLHYFLQPQKWWKINIQEIHGTKDIFQHIPPTDEQTFFTLFKHKDYILLAHLTKINLLGQNGQQLVVKLTTGFSHNNAGQWISEHISLLPIQVHWRHPSNQFSPSSRQILFSEVRKFRNKVIIITNNEAYLKMNLQLWIFFFYLFYNHHLHHQHYHFVFSLLQNEKFNSLENAVGE